MLMFVFFPPNFTEESLQWANEHSELWLTDRDIELEKCEQNLSIWHHTRLGKVAKIDRSLTLVTKVKSG